MIIPLLLSSVLGGAFAVAQDLVDDDPLRSSLGMDRVVLRDGRVLQGTVVREDEQVFLHLPHGRLRVPADSLADVFLAPEEDHVPRDAREERWLRQGYVYFERAWMPSAQRERILEERRREHEERLAELELRSDFAHAWIVETAHFRVRSNTSEALLAECARLLEQFWGEFDEQWGLRAGAAARGPRPEVRIYRDREQYLEAGGPASTSGFFRHTDRVLCLHHDHSDPEATLDVLFHEGTHLLLHLLRPRFLFPVWLDEGLAEYYGSARPEASGELRIGDPQQGRLVVLRRALEQDRLLPLEALLGTPRERFGALHYAEAWSLVHWLLGDPRHARRFRAFFLQLAAGRGLRESSVEVGQGSRRVLDLGDVRDLLLRHLRMRDVGELEAAWREHVRTALPEPGPRGWLVAGKLHYRDRQIRKAIEALHRAIELGSRDPTAHRTLARSHRILEEWDACAAAFRSCAEIDPLDPELRHEYGQSLVEGRNVPGELRAEGEVQLYLAAELAPEEPRFRRSLERLRDRR